MTHKFNMLAVEHMTSNAIQVSQNCEPKTQYFNKSFATANVITKLATNKSAMAKLARKRFPIRRRPRSVYMASTTKMFPAIDMNIKMDGTTPEKVISKKNFPLFSTTDK